MPKHIPPSILSGQNLMVVTITLDANGELHFQSWTDTAAPEFAQVLSQVIPPLVEAAVEETAAVCKHPLVHLQPLSTRLVQEG